MPGPHSLGQMAALKIHRAQKVWSGLSLECLVWPWANSVEDCNVWYWVPVLNCYFIQYSVVTTRVPPPEAFGTACSGETKGLEEGRMTSKASMSLNTFLARERLSWVRQRALAMTGCPVVIMKCLTVVVRCKNVWVVIAGISVRIGLNWLAEVEVVPKLRTSALAYLRGDSKSFWHPPVVFGQDALVVCMP